jgi:hypothetical protein
MLFLHFCNRLDAIEYREPGLSQEYRLGNVVAYQIRTQARKSEVQTTVHFILYWLPCRSPFLLVCLMWVKSIGCERVWVKRADENERAKKAQ